MVSGAPRPAPQALAASLAELDAAWNPGLITGVLRLARPGDPRPAAEPEGVDALVAAYGRLPLALRVAAALLASEPGLPMTAAGCRSSSSTAGMMGTAGGTGVGRATRWRTGDLRALLPAAAPRPRPQAPSAHGQPRLRLLHRDGCRPDRVHAPRARRALAGLAAHSLLPEHPVGGNAFNALGPALPDLRRFDGVVGVLTEAAEPCADDPGSEGTAPTNPGRVPAAADRSEAAVRAYERRLLSPTGRYERTVEAHTGDVEICRGSATATGRPGGHRPVPNTLGTAYRLAELFGATGDRESAAGAEGRRATAHAAAESTDAG